MRGVRALVAALWMLGLAHPAHGQQQETTRPVIVEDIARTTEGPPSPADAAYDDRLRASRASAEGFQGPLAGRWTLLASGGERLELQINDRGGVLEGAWRDTRRPGALDASGFIDDIARTTDGLSLRIGDRVAALRPDSGGWRGELTLAGRSEPVTLRRPAP